MPEMQLAISEQRTVEFYDDELIAVRAGDGQIYVSIRQMCQALEIDIQAQRRRIGRNDVLSDGLGVAKIATPGGPQDAHVLRVDLVPLWLTGISTRSIKNDAIRDKLKRFQREAARVLWEAFQTGRLTTETSIEALLDADTPAARAYQLARAVADLALNQVLLEAKLENQQSALSDHEQRLESIEAALGAPDRYVTPDQAMQISQAVKAVAIVLSKQSGSSQFGAVYGELYRRFGITSYKQLPTRDFDAAMKWLTEWHQSLTDDQAF